MKDLRPTLLFIFAHPDDESFSGAGTSMTCAAAGARTVLVTATRGERGKAGNPPVCAPGEIAAWHAASSDRFDDQPGADFVIDVSAWRDRRIAALGAHRSQHLSIDRHFFNKPDLDRILATEIWRQASGPPLLDRPAADLFIDL